MDKSNKELNLAGQWIYRLRSVFLSLPVAAVALILAIRNMVKLPDSVMFSSAALNDVGNLVFQNITISKALAVWGPFGITLVCLAMVILSKRVVYPWLISLFSLIIPVLLLLINTFP